MVTVGTNILPQNKMLALVTNIRQYCQQRTNLISPIDRQKSDIIYSCCGMIWTCFTSDPAFPLYCMSKITKDVYPTFSNITSILWKLVVVFYVLVVFAHIGDLQNIDRVNPTSRTSGFFNITIF